MSNPRFLQVHFLAPYTAALLNRDDTGLAKRLPYGGALRTRVSSQCLKRHWRLADDPHAMSKIDGAEASYRSRRIIEHKVFEDWSEDADEEIIRKIKREFIKKIYGDEGVNIKKRQTLLLGAPEVDYLTKTAKTLVEKAEKAGVDKDTVEDFTKEWIHNLKGNLDAFRKSAKLPGGLTGALFGRMMTSDPSANIDAAVHVAHAFTVHAEEAESDYFTAVDDLARDEESGADTIQETELTSGLFYGYVVVDLPALLNNLGGDTELASDVLHNLIYLIAEVSPGAKLGSTAPYSRASFLLLETGDRQPRSLAEAFRNPCDPEIGSAVKTLSKHLAALDKAYATGEQRRVMSVSNHDLPGAERGTLAELAEFAKSQPGHLGGVGII